MAVYQSIHDGGYIDQQISEVDKKLPLTGGTVTGDIIYNIADIDLTQPTNNCAIEMTPSTYHLTDSNNLTISKLETLLSPSTGDIVSHWYVGNCDGTGNSISKGIKLTLDKTGVLTGILNGNFTVNKIFGAVYNDYAEYRNQKERIEPGYCVTSEKNGKIFKTTKHLQNCEGIVSDTFGFAIGETDECRTPLAVAGRVLVYYNGDREDYNPGDVVCAGENGKINKMTREEIREWPDRIIGIVSEIPEYETWGRDNILVNNRIWIKVK